MLNKALKQPTRGERSSTTRHEIKTRRHKERVAVEREMHQSVPISWENVRQRGSDKRQSAAGRRTSSSITTRLLSQQQQQERKRNAILDAALEIDEVADLDNPSVSTHEDDKIDDDYEDDRPLTAQRKPSKRKSHPRLKPTAIVREPINASSANKARQHWQNASDPGRLDLGESNTSRHVAFASDMQLGDSSKGETWWKHQTSRVHDTLGEPKPGDVQRNDREEPGMDRSAPSRLEYASRRNEPSLLSIGIASIDTHDSNDEPRTRSAATAAALLDDDGAEDDDQKRRSQSEPVVSSSDIVKKTTKASNLKSKLNKSFKRGIGAKRYGKYMSTNDFQDSVLTEASDIISTSTGNTTLIMPSNLTDTAVREEITSIDMTDASYKSAPDPRSTKQAQQQSNRLHSSLTSLSKQQTQIRRGMPPHGGIDPLALRDDSSVKLSSLKSPQRRVTESVDFLAQYLDKYDDLDTLFTKGLEDAAAASMSSSRTSEDVLEQPYVGQRSKASKSSTDQVTQPKAPKRKSIFEKLKKNFDDLNKSIPKMSSKGNKDEKKGQKMKPGLRDEEQFYDDDKSEALSSQDVHSMRSAVSASASSSVLARNTLSSVLERETLPPAGKLGYLGRRSAVSAQSNTLNDMSDMSKGDLESPFSKDEILAGPAAFDFESIARDIMSKKRSKTVPNRLSGNLRRTQSLTMEDLISPELDDDTDPEDDKKMTAAFSKSLNDMDFYPESTKSAVEVRNELRKKASLRRRVKRSLSPGRSIRGKSAGTVLEKEGVNASTISLHHTVSALNASPGLLNVSQRSFSSPRPRPRQKIGKTLSGHGSSSVLTGASASRGASQNKLQRALSPRTQGKKRQAAREAATEHSEETGRERGSDGPRRTNREKSPTNNANRAIDNRSKSTRKSPHRPRRKAATAQEATRVSLPSVPVSLIQHGAGMHRSFPELAHKPNNHEHGQSHPHLHYGSSKGNVQSRLGHTSSAHTMIRQAEEVLLGCIDDNKIPPHSDPSPPTTSSSCVKATTKSDGEGLNSSSRLSSSIDKHELEWDDFNETARQHALQSIPWRNTRGLSYHLRLSRISEIEDVSKLQLDDTFHRIHRHAVPKSCLKSENEFCCSRNDCCCKDCKSPPLYHRPGVGILYSEEKEQDTAPSHRGRLVQGSEHVVFPSEDTSGRTVHTATSSLIYPDCVLDDTARHLVMDASLVSLYV